MRVARLCSGGVNTYGVVRDGMVATMEDMARQTGVPVPASVKSFLFDGWLEEIRTKGISYEQNLDGFTVLAPIDAPPKIICLAFNYYDHASEQNVTVPDGPVIVFKPRTALTGPYADIRCPGFVRELDYEIELAFVMGRECRNVSEDEAMGAVAGYMILNDVTARDIQFKDGQFGRAKGMDTFAPCGPWITTADEIADPHSLKLVTKVNGQTRQDATTAGMSVRIPQIISRLSRGMTLERGDVISTGTPAGVALKSSRFGFLKDGDRIDMEIQGLGAISNVVRFDDP